MRQISEQYRAYLNSPKWAQIRENIINRDGGACRLCGKKEKLQVHHLRGRYRFHEENHSEDLITLCDACHQTVHRYFAEKDMQEARYALEKFKNQR